MSEIRDLERLMMRIETGYASPRDLAGLRFSLEHVAPLVTTPRSVYRNSSRSSERESFRCDPPLWTRSEAALSMPPRFRLSDGGIFRPGFHAELDELRSLQTDSHAWIARYQVQLKEQLRSKRSKSDTQKHSAITLKSAAGKPTKFRTTSKEGKHSSTQSGSSRPNSKNSNIKCCMQKKKSQP